MSYTDYNSHFVEKFHQDELEGRIHYCQTVLKKECATCGNESCSLHGKYKQEPKEEVTDGL